MLKNIHSIVLEGGEGCGKSTQIQLLKNYFARKNIDALFLREPGATPIGEQIRSVIVSKENTEMTPECEVLLFAAARSQNIVQNIFPAIVAGKVVVLDRFVESSYVYQGYSRGLDVDKIIDINNFVMGGFHPDITLYLDIDPEKAMARIMENNRDLNRLDLEGLEFMRKVREGYLLRAKQNPNYVIIDANGTETEVFERIKNALQI